MKNDLFTFYENLLTYKLTLLNQRFDQDEFARITNPLPFENTIPYEEFLQLESSIASRKILRDFEIDIEEASRDTQLMQVDKFKGRISYYIDKIHLEDFHRQFPFFHSDLKKILGDIPLRYADILKGSVSNIEVKVPPGNKEPTALVWNNGVASIATLFYDLVYQYKTTKGKACLEAEPGQLVEFIHRYFRDGDISTLFSEESIKTYCDPKRTDKKAKTKRINVEKSIPNISKTSK